MNLKFFFFITWSKNIGNEFPDCRPNTYIHQWFMLQCSNSIRLKVKWYSSPVPVISGLRGVTCHMGSHSVICHPTQVNTPRLNPSHTGRYSIYLPLRDGRLSWPRWMVTYRDGLAIQRVTYSSTKSSLATDPTEITVITWQLISNYIKSKQHMTSYTKAILTDQPLLLDTICQWHQSCFGHLCHANTSQDHSRALQACIRGPPKDWRHRPGRPRQTWLRTVEDDLHPLKGGALWIDRHGVNSWTRLRLCDMLQTEKENRM